MQAQEQVEVQERATGETTAVPLREVGRFLREHPRCQGSTAAMLRKAFNELED